jgi:hypothetical protein
VLRSPTTYLSFQLALIEASTRRGAVRRGKNHRTNRHVSYGFRAHRPNKHRELCRLFTSWSNFLAVTLFSMAAL